MNEAFITKMNARPCLGVAVFNGRRRRNEYQADFVQHRYGTSHSGWSENADTAGDKAAAHKTKMEQYRLARLE